MKFSKSLLNNPFMAQQFFNKTVSKATELIMSVFPVFEFNFKEHNVDLEKYIHSFTFVFLDRKLSVDIFLHEKEDFLYECLSLREEYSDNVTFVSMGDTFSENITTIIKDIENKYLLNLIPLDPNTKDENVVDIKVKDNLLTIELNQNHYDGKLKINYQYSVGGENSYSLNHYVNHLIYLD